MTTEPVDTPPRAVFQISRLVLVFAALCAVPVGFGVPFLWIVYLAPIGVVVWVLRVRTVVDSEAVTVESAGVTARTVGADQHAAPR